MPYTGSDVHASGRCLDKHSFKQLMQAQGLDTPEWHSFNREAFSEFGAAESLASQQLGACSPLKPARQASSGLVVGGAGAVRPGDPGRASATTTAVIERYVSRRSSR